MEGDYYMYDLEDEHYPSISTACRAKVDFPGGAIQVDPSLQVQVGEHTLVESIL